MHTKLAKENPALAERIFALHNLSQATTFLLGCMDEKIEAASGLSLGENEVLVRLHFHGPRLPMHDLSELLLLSKSGVTRLVDRLEAVGLVRREVSGQDRRVTYAVLTDEGRKRLSRSMPAFVAAVEQTLGQNLTDDDVSTLRRILRKILEGNEQWDPRRCHHHGGEESMRTSHARATAEDSATV